MSTTLWIIFAGALATYFTRIGGHVILSRFDKIHPRVDAGLRAVPAAVLTAIVAPYAAFFGLAETLTLMAVAALALFVPALPLFFIGWCLILAARYLLG